MSISQACSVGSRSCRHIIPLALASMLLLSMVAPLQAQETVEVKVAYDDLNLARPADAVRLYERLKAAAREACDSQAELRDLKLQLLQQRCYDQSLQRAVQGIGHVSVTAIHAADKALATG